jgi:riboflavin biosynthesis pyrimidine reductase
MNPLTVLFEDAPAPPTSLPKPLADLYGGGLELGDDLVYANMVTSLDGVSSLGQIRGSVALLSGRAEGDRFVMGLLRALADCLLLGASTLRANPGHLWTPGYIHPPSATLFEKLGRPAPTLVIVSASGNLDPSERALRDNALVLTTAPSADRLRSWGVPAQSVGDPPFSAQAILKAIRAQGFRRVLVEAGPTLLAQLIEQGLLEELFLTLSPVFAGRKGDDGRLGLLEGVHLLPDRPYRTRLRSVRQWQEHLFLRYDLSAQSLRY